MAISPGILNALEGGTGPTIATQAPPNSYGVAGTNGYLPGIFNALEGGTGPAVGSQIPPPGGGGTAPITGSPDLSAAEFQAYFSQYGMPSDLQNQIISILKQYADNPALAVTLAQQAVRQSQWFQQTYPGFSQGVSNGLFSDETGYRSYMNQINQISQQYLGRPVSGSEIAGYLTSGYAPSYVANLFQGQAYIGANKNDIQYLAGAFGPGQLNQGQLTALGNEQAGIDTQLGQLEQKIQQKAAQIRAKLFSTNGGQASVSLGTQGLYSPSLQGMKGKPDVAA